MTIPLTYSLLLPSTNDENLAPRIKTDYKPVHGDVVDGLRAKQKRQQRKVKRTMVALAGWGLMGFMAYLIMYTQPSVPKIWNPYDILGISEVGKPSPCRLRSSSATRSSRRRAD